MAERRKQGSGAGDMTPRERDCCWTVCNVLIVVLAIVVSFVAGAVHKYEGFDNAFYQLLPYMNATHFANIGSVLARGYTCHINPFLQNTGLIDPALDCLEEDDLGVERPLLVTLSAAKGGSIMSGRTGVDVSAWCGFCTGYGYRPNAFWPPPQETLPTYKSDVLLAIANMQSWPEYATKYHSSYRCVATTREPFSRLRSLFLYSITEGETFFHNISQTVKNQSARDAVATMWNSFARETMIDTQKHLVNGLNKGCVQIDFGNFNDHFEDNVRKILETWKIKPKHHEFLINVIADKHDFNRRSKAQIESDHHHTASKFSKEYIDSIKKAMSENPEIMELVRKQRIELNYDPDTGYFPPPYPEKQ